MSSVAVLAPLLNAVVFNANAVRANLSRDLGRSATLVLRVRPELKAALERLATNERRSISNYVEIILEEHVQKAPSKRR